MLGWIGKLPGAVLGGILIGLIRSMGSGYFDERWTSALIFVILIAILVFRPAGLLGDRRGEGEGRSLWYLAILGVFLLVYPFSGMEGVAIRLVDTPIQFASSSSTPSSQWDSMLRRLRRPVAPGHCRVFRHRRLHRRNPHRAEPSVSNRLFSAIFLSVVEAAMLGLAAGHAQRCAPRRLLAINTPASAMFVAFFGTSTTSAFRKASTRSPPPITSNRRSPCRRARRGVPTYHLYYYLNLAYLVLAIVLLRNLENSRLRRAWMLFAVSNSRTHLHGCVRNAG
ncbi:MAG: hypothetical protein U0744_09105 [Gemmataceae bacterium]